MTDREICAVLDSKARRPVRAYDVHTRLRDFADRGQVEMDRPVDAPNRYRLVREPSGPQDRTYVQRQYEATFPEGEFSATDLGRVMGVNRITASRHARRALAKGLLTSEKRGTTVYYRRADL
jgi:DNA-binding transcriptional ArsR family regulator